MDYRNYVEIKRNVEKIMELAILITSSWNVHIIYEYDLQPK